KPAEAPDGDSEQKRDAPRRCKCEQHSGREQALEEEQESLQFDEPWILDIAHAESDIHIAAPFKGEHLSARRLQRLLLLSYLEELVGCLHDLPDDLVVLGFQCRRSHRRPCSTSRRLPFAEFH